MKHHGKPNEHLPQRLCHGVRCSRNSRWLLKGNNHVTVKIVPCDTCPALVDRFALAADKLAHATLELSKLTAVGVKISANLKSVKLLRKECTIARDQLDRHRRDAHRNSKA